MYVDVCVLCGVVVHVVGDDVCVVVFKHCFVMCDLCVVCYFMFVLCIARVVCC